MSRKALLFYVMAAFSAKSPDRPRPPDQPIDAYGSVVSGQRNWFLAPAVTFQSRACRQKEHGIVGRGDLYIVLRRPKDMIGRIRTSNTVVTVLRLLSSPEAGKAVILGAKNGLSFLVTEKGRQLSGVLQ